MKDYSKLFDDDRGYLHTPSDKITKKDVIYYSKISAIAAAVGLMATGVLFGVDRATDHIAETPDGEPLVIVCGVDVPIADEQIALPIEDARQLVADGDATYDLGNCEPFDQNDQPFGNVFLW